MRARSSVDSARVTGGTRWSTRTAWARRLACALAGVVDHERVDEGEVAEGGVGEAGRRQGVGLAGQPLQCAVLAHVDHGVGAPALGHPAVEREVVRARSGW